jgi:hypothetical protein
MFADVAQSICLRRKVLHLQQVARNNVVVQDLRISAHKKSAH